MNRTKLKTLDIVERERERESYHLFNKELVYSTTGICIQKGLQRTNLDNLKVKKSYIITTSNRHY